MTKMTLEIGSIMWVESWASVEASSVLDNGLCQSLFDFYPAYWPGQYLFVLFFTDQFFSRRKWKRAPVSSVCELYSVYCVQYGALLWRVSHHGNYHGYQRESRAVETFVTWPASSNMTLITPGTVGNYTAGNYRYGGFVYFWCMCYKCTIYSAT